MKKLLTILLVVPCFSFFQCQTQNKQLGFVSEVSDGGGKANKTAASVDNVSSLVAYAGTAQQLTVQEKDRGGTFKLVHNATMQDDYGMIFPAEGKKDAHWMRTTEKDDPVNLKWYGAKGEGIAHYKDDSAALVKAIAFIAGKGGGKLYIPASTSFYGYNGLGILLPDNIEIYGDGDKSEIKHVNPEVGGTFYRGVIFYTTSYGANNFNGITRAPTYEIEDAKKGQSYVTTKTNDASGQWKVGDIIGLGANYFFKRNLEFKARYAQFEINEITKVSGNKAYLKYPLSIDLLYAKPQPQSDSKKLSKQGQKQKQLMDESFSKAKGKDQALKEQNEKNTGFPVLIDISADKTYNQQFGAYDRISRNIYLHNFKLSQADYNMIRNTPYAAQKQPNNVIGLGGTFESKFDHLTIEGVGTFGGNLWNRCEISNLTIYSQWKLVDMGYGSANTKMHDINWIFKPTKIRDTSTALVYMDDGTHDIELYNIKVSGPWSLGNIFQVAGGAHNINIHDVEINFPQYDMKQGRAISIRDDNAHVYVYDVTFKNVVFKVKNIQYYIIVNGLNLPGVDKNIKFEGVHFSQQAQHNGNSVAVENSNGIEFSDVSIPAGNIALSNVSGSKLENIKAPNSTIVFAGEKPQLTNSSYRELKAGAVGGGRKNH